MSSSIAQRLRAALPMINYTLNKMNVRLLRILVLFWVPFAYAYAAVSGWDQHSLAECLAFYAVVGVLGIAACRAAASEKNKKHHTRQEERLLYVVYFFGMFPLSVFVPPAGRWNVLILCMDLKVLQQTKFFLVQHMIACLWTTLSAQSDSCWIRYDECIDCSFLRRYLRANYFAASTLITVGLGDVRAMCFTETCFCILFMIVGAATSTHLVSGFGIYFETFYQSQALHSKRLSHVKQLAVSYHLPETITRQMITFHEHNFHTQQGFDEATFLGNLPFHLRTDVMMALAGPALRRIPFLNGTPTVLLNAIASSLQFAVLTPGSTIWVKESMWLVAAGTCHASGRICGPGHSIGELFMFEPDMLNHSLAIHTPSDGAACELFQCTSQAFEDALRLCFEEWRLEKQRMYRLARSSSSALITKTILTSAVSESKEEEKSEIKGAINTTTTNNNDDKAVSSPMWLVILDVLNLLILPVRFIVAHSHSSAWVWSVPLDIGYDMVTLFVLFRSSCLASFISPRNNKTTMIAAKSMYDIASVLAMPTSLLCLILFGSPTAYLTARCLSLSRLRSFATAFTYHRKREAFSIVLGMEFVRLLLLWHCFACAWIFVADTGRDSYGSWDDNVRERGLSRYIRALYYSAVISTTTGYGDIQAQSTTETLVATVFMLGSGIFYYSTVGSIATILGHMLSAEQEFELHLDAVYRFLDKESDLQPELAARIRGFYAHVWESQHGMDLASVYQDLAPFLRSHVQDAIFFGTHLLQRSALMQDEPQTLLLATAQMMHLVEYVPQDPIVRAGEMIQDDVFFHLLLHGRAEIRLSESNFLLGFLDEEQGCRELILDPQVEAELSLTSLTFSRIGQLQMEPFLKFVREHCPQLLPSILRNYNEAVLSQALLVENVAKNLNVFSDRFADYHRDS